MYNTPNMDIIIDIGIGNRDQILWKGHCPSKICTIKAIFIIQITN